MNPKQSCRILVGTRATRIKIPNTDVTHEWIVYVRSPKNIIKNVQYKLHESFANNVILTEYPFEHKERGWGEFTIQIKIILFNDDRLKLHGEGDIVINESIDEIVYKGMGNEFPPCGGEQIEYKKIDEGIEYMLKLFRNDD